MPAKENESFRAITEITFVLLLSDKPREYYSFTILGMMIYNNALSIRPDEDPPCLSLSLSILDTF